MEADDFGITLQRKKVVASVLLFVIVVLRSRLKVKCELDKEDMLMKDWDHAQSRVYARRPFLCGTSVITHGQRPGNAI